MRSALELPYIERITTTYIREFVQSRHLMGKLDPSWLLSDATNALHGEARR
jgi:hypothetical protein